MKRIIAALTTLFVMLAGLVLVAGPASATDSNHPDFWENEPGEVCVKVDDRGTEEGGYTVPAEPTGRDWSTLIIKKGSGSDQNDVEENPVARQTYFWHGQNRGYSHVILCSVPEPTTQNPVKVEPKIVALDECGTKDDFVRGVDNVGYTHNTVRDGLVYTTTFTANPGYVIDGQNPVVTTLTNKDCPTPPPPPKDVCPNIDGPQSEVPAGHVMQNGNCVLPPPPPPVTPEPPVTVVPPVVTTPVPPVVNPPVNTPPKEIRKPKAAIRSACTGMVGYILNNTKSNVAVTYKYLNDGKVKSVVVKAGKKKVFAEKAKANSLAWIKAKGMATVKTRVPGVCHVPHSGFRK